MQLSPSSGVAIAAIISITVLLIRAFVNRFGEQGFTINGARIGKFLVANGSADIEDMQKVVRFPK